MRYGSEGTDTSCLSLPGPIPLSSTISDLASIVSVVAGSTRSITGTTQALGKGRHVLIPVSRILVVAFATRVPQQYFPENTKNGKILFLQNPNIQLNAQLSSPCDHEFFLETLTAC